jgi:N,N'-diacetyllegionaminate synthase
VKIGDRDSAARPLLIAEIGQNHEGDVAVARELILRAAEAGADAVKFQTFRTELFISPNDTERFARMKRFELTHDEFAELAELAHEQGVLFLSTPLDLESARFLDGIVDAFKIASGDNTFYPLIQEVARTGKPLILAAGLAEIGQMQHTLDVVRSEAGASEEIAVLHCVSAYPVPPDEANLGAIRSLAEALDCTIGYSDHTLGIEAAALSIGYGARIVEKHFTLAHDYSEFRDHRLSAEPAELAELVLRLRSADVLRGSAEKTLQPSEAEGVLTMRRSIVAARDLESGEIVEQDDLMWIRPGGGLAPGDEHLLLGRRLKRPVALAAPFDLADVE